MAPTLVNPGCRALRKALVGIDGFKEKAVPINRQETQQQDPTAEKWLLYRPPGMLRARNDPGAVMRTSGLSSALTPSIVRVARNSRAATGNSLEQLKDGTLKSLGSYRLSVRQRIHRQLT